TGEAIEIAGPAGTRLAGWTVLLYNGSTGTVYSTQRLGGSIPPTCGARGVVVVRYPGNGIQNGSPDGVALIDARARVVELLSYEGTFTARDGAARGIRSTDIGVAEGNSTAAGTSLQRDSAGRWFGPAPSSFGACNPARSATLAAAPGRARRGAAGAITFGGRRQSDPPLPVGFEDQLFATLRDAHGKAIATTFTWTSETPRVATIDRHGVVHAVAAGRAVFRATAATGATATYALRTIRAAPSTTARYGDNTEFGVPVDADSSDDFLVRRPEYTLSYNAHRGTPNWVSYDLDASQFGTGVRRCDCFTFDPALPATFTHLTTADYTGASAAAGFRIDRGHLVRSFDRSAGMLDNATTYYLSNVIPEAADLNQGPWAAMEDYLGDLARKHNKEVYIIAGPAGNRGTVKHEGTIVIPASVWKIAVIVPRDEGLADVHAARDVTVIAVIMPNVPGVRHADWRRYETTVDSVEALSGYDLLSLLPDSVERAVESRPPPR
ncbi:MAG TPA: DNA/RNA non-specific endonuclease, partial [Gemmatimonadaceae bacterium]|nr:DNA/RNA non-specific endonuclease [Gemmatimonadaceae bacterium]